ncbi:molybdopterin molybdenumtransferase MoeA [Halobacteriales archaeon QH_2_65_14]|nr:MAG: molybdopterin molybdenumtransferase MoeA [Halobacteriales archaeon QH_2_65_14]
MSEHSHSPFKERTSLAEARDRLRERVAQHGRTEAAMDGYAVRAEDTFGASDRSPVVLHRTDGDIGPRTATQVHTGSKLPESADAVVMIEHLDEVGDEIEVFGAVSGGENVAPVGEDVEAGQHLYDPGHRLSASDLGLLKSVGHREVEVVERPRVAVIPTGEELVQTDPGPGEVIETNGLTVSQLVRQWGGEPTYHDVVTDNEERLGDAIRDSLWADLVVTSGGSSVGARDLLPDVVSELGEVFVHGVGVKPGHPVALGVVDGTPVLMLPGYPVSCLINAVQFLRPAIKWTAGTSVEPFPTVTARLGEKIYSEPGLRSFARVTVEKKDCERVATAVRASGAGVLSSVALSDGWVVVPEESEGFDAGEPVGVRRWEWSP